MKRFGTSDRWLGLAILLVGSVLAIGTSAANVTITFMTPQPLQCYKEVVSRFEAEHPGMKVTLLSTGWDVDKLLVSVGGGAGPDVVEHGEAAMPGLVKAGLLRSLDAEFDQWDQPGKYRYFPWVFQRTISNGRMHWLPMTVDVRLLAYRSDLFDEAGLDVKAMNTWSDWGLYAQRLARYNSDQRLTRYGMSMVQSGPSVAQTYALLIRQAGGELFDDASQPLFNAPEGIRALEIYSDLLNHYQPGALQGLAVSPPSGVDSIVSGHAAMSWTSVGPFLQGESYAKGLGEVLQARMVPVPEHNRPGVTHVSSTGVAVLAHTKHPEAAWCFVAFLQRPDNNGLVNSLVKQLPPHMGGYQMDVIRQIPQLRSFMAAQEESYARGNPMIANWIQLRNEVIIPMVVDVINGRDSITNLLINAERKARAIR